MSIRASSLAAAALFAAAFAFADNGPPLASVWNIAPTGSADSSGALRFRVKPDDGEPVDISVPVIMGANAETIARGIRSSLSSQLRADRFKVQLGQGANVLVSDPRGRPHFSVELVDSDVDNLRVAVHSVTPSATPTVPKQALPAEPPTDAPPPNDTPGDVIPPPADSAPAPGATTRQPSDTIPVPSQATPVPAPPEAPSPSMPAPRSATPVPPAATPVPPAASPPKPPISR
jgi:hypothetical protein